MSVKNRIRKMLFGIARIKITGSFIGFALTYFPFLVPVKKISQSKTAVSFWHPAPSYTNHRLIVPRKIARNVFCLGAEDFLSVLDMATQICRECNGDYVLLINGGSRQDVMQAHFHLFTGNLAMQKGLSKEAGQAFLQEDTIFWAHMTEHLRDFLAANGVSEKSFSLLIQFEKNGKGAGVYFI